MQAWSMLICLPFGAYDGARSSFGWLPLLSILMLGAISTGAGFMCAVDI